MIARRIVTAVATLLAVTGLGACGREAVAEQQRRPEPAAIAPSPAAVVRPATRDTQAADRVPAGLRNVPSAFRLPPGSRVTALSDHESGASFTLDAPDPESVLSFYRSALPQGAFTIVADRAEPGATSLAFRNADGWAGMIYATTHRVTVAVRRA
jgi:hypothetical protein